MKLYKFPTRTLRTREINETVYLLTIYDKSEIESINESILDEFIDEIIKE
jgi:hypothetical protein